MKADSGQVVQLNDMSFRLVTPPGFAVSDVIQKLNNDVGEAADVSQKNRTNLQVVIILPHSLDQWLDVMVLGNDADQDNIHNALKEGEVFLESVLADMTPRCVIHPGDASKAAVDVQKAAATESYTIDSATKNKIWQLLNELKRKLYS